MSPDVGHRHAIAVRLTERRPLAALHALPFTRRIPGGRAMSKRRLQRDRQRHPDIEAGGVSHAAAPDRHFRREPFLQAVDVLRAVTGAGHHDHVHELVLARHHPAIHIFDLLQADLATTRRGLEQIRTLRAAEIGARIRLAAHDQRERHAAIGCRQPLSDLARQRLEDRLLVRRAQGRDHDGQAFGRLCSGFLKRGRAGLRIGRAIRARHGACGERGRPRRPVDLNNPNIGFHHIERQADEIDAGGADRLDRLLHLQQQRRFLPLRLRQIRQHDASDDFDVAPFAVRCLLTEVEPQIVEVAGCRVILRAAEVHLQIGGHDHRTRFGGHRPGEEAGQFRAAGIEERFERLGHGFKHGMSAQLWWACSERPVCSLQAGGCQWWIKCRMRSTTRRKIERVERGAPSSSSNGARRSKIQIASSGSA